MVIFVVTGLVYLVTDFIFGAEGRRIPLGIVAGQVRRPYYVFNSFLVVGALLAAPFDGAPLAGALCWCQTSFTVLLCWCQTSFTVPDIFYDKKKDRGRSASVRFKKGVVMFALQHLYY